MDALRIELKIKRKRNIRRRKKKEVYKTTTTDDKRLQSTLKRVGVNTIPGVEEANIYKCKLHLTR
uniref:NAC-A/B domain-containing protein n=1 Tax=Aegilops tauschii subsp. strangulata TaxID=200361 RepID=A0A453F152_AEGTS